MDETKDPNRFFNARLGSEGKLRILLSQASSGLQTGGNQDDPTQGVDNQSQVRDYRRPVDELIPSKKQFINFWDLGQINVGSASVDDRRIDATWADLDYNYTMPVTDYTSLPPTLGPMVSEYETLRDLIFAVPVADWDTMFRKLSYEQAERYGLDIINPITHDAWAIARNGSRYMYDNSVVNKVVADSKWTKKGWVKPSTGLDTWWMTAFGGAFEFLTNDGNCYVTTEQDPAASHVSFTLGKKADVFLLPQLVYGFRDAVSGDGLSHQVVLGALQTMLRAALLFPNQLVSGYPAYSFDNPSSDPKINIGFASFLEFAFFETSNAVAYRSFPPTFTTSVDDPSTYPRYTDGGHSSQIQQVLEAGHTTVRHTTGDFLGAIRQDGTMYYFWATDNFRLNIPATIRPIPNAWLP